MRRASATQNERRKKKETNELEKHKDSICALLWGGRMGQATKRHTVFVLRHPFHRTTHPTSHNLRHHTAAPLARHVADVLVERGGGGVGGGRVYPSLPRSLAMAHAPINKLIFTPHPHTTPTHHRWPGRACFSAIRPSTRRLLLRWPLSASTAAPPRRAVIVGAGLQGVTTAYALHQRGVHDITLLERGPEVARFASRANCGMICPILSQPLNSVGTARVAVAAALKAMAGVEQDRRRSKGVVVGRGQLANPHFMAWGLLVLALLGGDAGQGRPRHVRPSRPPSAAPPPASPPRPAA